MPYFTDQMGNRLMLPHRPQRIVSLVPSQSEFIWDLGLQAELVGITRFCVHPAQMFHSATRVGGTKTLDLGRIRELKPDIIIGNREENTLGQIALLKKEFNVWMSDIESIEQAYEMMSALGAVLGKATEAESLLARIRTGMESCRGLLDGKRVAYFIWQNPWMLAGRNTFIGAMLQHLGLVNVAAEMSRYPEINAGDLSRLNPEYCLLSSEPFPFAGKHASALQALLPAARMLFVDGEVLSWYGSRLLQVPAYAAQLRAQMSPGTQAG